MSVFVGFGVLTAYGYAVFAVWLEEEGEDAGGFGVVADGGLGNGPTGAAIFRVEDPGSAGAEPGFFRAVKGKAGIAGGEGAFIGQGWRELPAVPGFAGVARGKDDEAAPDRVAQYDAVLRVPEFQAVEEAFVTGVEKGPGFAGVFGKVEFGFFFVAAT
jgi:hypothetical protein